jgi:hypothetical protein
MKGIMTVHVYLVVGTNAKNHDLTCAMFILSFFQQKNIHLHLGFASLRNFSDNLLID